MEDPFWKEAKKQNLLDSKGYSSPVHLSFGSQVTNNALEARRSSCLWVEPWNLWSCHGQGRSPRASSGGVGLLALILALCHPCGDIRGPSPSMPITDNLFCGFNLGLHFPPPQMFQVCRVFCFVCLPYILDSNSGPWAPTRPPPPHQRMWLLNRA